MKVGERGLRKISIALAVVLVFAIQAVLPIPLRGQEFATYETQGPRIDYLNILIYKNVEAETLALQKGDIDMIDWPLPPEKIHEIQANPKLKIISFPDYGFMYIGVNLRKPPLDDVRFRQALAYLIPYDKILSDVLKGYGEILSAGLFTSAYAAGGWQNPAVRQYTYDPEKAKATLDAAGYTLDPATEKRIDPKTGKSIRDIIILSRIDDPGRKLSADLLSDAAQKIGIPLKAEPRERAYISTKVYVEYNYDMFTGGWVLGDIPDWVYDFFHSDQLPEKHNMAPWWYNYVGINNATLDKCAYQLKYGLSVESAKQAALKAQEILAEQLPYLPLYSQYNLIGVNVADWEGYVRRTGRVDATVGWSVFNVHRKGVPYGGTFKLGFKSDIEKMNPFDSTWYWDWMVLGEIYDSLLSTDPFHPPELKPWMAKTWTVEKWSPMVDVVAPVVTFNLCDNITWHDGVKFTSKDVKFTIEYFRDKESAYWYSFVQNVQKIETPDNYTVKVYYSEPTPWADLWLGGLAIIPEHIWKDVKNPSTYEAWRESKLIGSGSFTLVEYKPGEFVRLKFNQNYFRRHLDHRLVLEKIEVTQGEKKAFETSPLIVSDVAITNATFTVSIKDPSGKVLLSVNGAHKSGGVYAAILDTGMLDVGAYIYEGNLATTIGDKPLVTTDVKELVVKAPFPVSMVAGIIIVVAVITAGGYIFLKKKRKIRRTLKPVKKRQKRSSSS